MKQMDIRQALYDECEDIMEFYNDLIDAMEDAEFKPAWEKGIYPAEPMMRDALKKRELIIGVQDSRIAAAMILNSDCAGGYDKVNWKVKAAKEEVVVIHALGVSPLFQGRGVAKKMLGFAVSLGREKGMKAIRLDVLSSNLPAQKLYPSAGFSYIDTIELFYEDTGRTDFLLYELAL